MHYLIIIWDLKWSEMIRSEPSPLHLWLCPAYHTAAQVPAKWKSLGTKPGRVRTSNETWMHRSQGMFHPQNAPGVWLARPRDRDNLHIQMTSKQMNRILAVWSRTQQLCLLYVHCMSTVFVCHCLLLVLHLSQFFTVTLSRFCTAAGQTLRVFAHELSMSLEGRHGKTAP